MNYYIKIDDQAYGPMTADQLFETYNPNPTAQISTDAAEWKALSEYPDLMKIFNEKNPDAEKMASKKMVFALLSILLPCLGIQWFMVGRKKQGIYTLVISFAGFFCFCLGPIFNIVNGIVQGIKILMGDDQNFLDKYVYNPKKFIIF